MKRTKLVLILVVISFFLSLAIYSNYYRYSNLKGTMEIQNITFQLVKLKSASAEWDVALNKIHSDNFPHFDLVNKAAIKYEREMEAFLAASSMIQGPIKGTITDLVDLSLDKKNSMSDYLSEVAVTRNSLKFLDTLLMYLHSTYENDDRIVTFLSHAERRLSVLVALNQNIILKEQSSLEKCYRCNAEQNDAIAKVNQHLDLLKNQVLLSHEARDSFYNVEYEKLFLRLFNELSSIYVKADMNHQTVQSQVSIFAVILVVAVVILLTLLYWLFLSIDGHRKAGITDTLTGLHNRKKLFENLASLIPLHKKSNNKLALLFIDLDGFKQVNDTHGHDIGDKLLQQVAARLIAGVRKQDSIYRIGGDEFIVLVPELQAVKHAESVAESLLNHCNKPYQLDNTNCSVTLSIGISLFPDHTEEANKLLKYADEAMYNSKRKGKGVLTTWYGSK